MHAKPERASQRIRNCLARHVFMALPDLPSAHGIQLEHLECGVFYAGRVDHARNMPG